MEINEKMEFEAMWFC